MKFAVPSQVNLMKMVFGFDSLRLLISFLLINRIAIFTQQLMLSGLD
jgi:hypothetical protein